MSQAGLQVPPRADIMVIPVRGVRAFPVRIRRSKAIFRILIHSLMLYTVFITALILICVWCRLSEYMYQHSCDSIIGSVIIREVSEDIHGNKFIHNCSIMIRGCTPLHEIPEWERSTKHLGDLCKYLSYPNVMINCNNNASVPLNITNP